jgi:glycosyltransferase involved in cell wall biosynthesis
MRQLAEKLTLAFQHTSKTKSILVVVLTKNYIKNTISLLSSMEQSKDSFDLLFVDDHSTDGTPEYLQRKGYAVINNKSGQGLTAFWNIGFRCVT